MNGNSGHRCVRTRLEIQRSFTPKPARVGSLTSKIRRHDARSDDADRPPPGDRGAVRTSSKVEGGRLRLARFLSRYLRTLARLPPSVPSGKAGRGAAADKMQICGHLCAD